MITRVILPTNYTFKRFIQTSTINYKGHAKWQNIKHIKATNDQQRSQMIAKQVRMMQLAVHGLYSLEFSIKHCFLLSMIFCFRGWISQSRIELNAPQCN